MSYTKQIVNDRSTVNVRELDAAFERFLLAAQDPVGQGPSISDMILIFALDIASRSFDCLSDEFRACVKERKLEPVIRCRTDIADHAAIMGRTDTDNAFEVHLSQAKVIDLITHHRASPRWSVAISLLPLLADIAAVINKAAKVNGIVLDEACLSSSELHQRVMHHNVRAFSVGADFLAH